MNYEMCYIYIRIHLHGDEDMWKSEMQNWRYGDIKFL